MHLYSRSLAITGLFLFLTFQLSSQTEGPFGKYLTPGGVMDTVFDRFGKKYAVKSLAIPTNSVSENTRPAGLSTQSCVAGMFEVYFGMGSGMENSTAPLDVQRRQTVCEVLSDISGLLGYNTSYPNSARVRILVDDLSNYTFPSSPSTSGVLGLCSGFYAVPLNPSNAYPGVTENLVEKTIKGRTDGWTNIISPLIPSNGIGYYHAVMAFNFANPGINWNSNIAITASATQFDLYTVILHEVTHALGFASLISVNGTSAFGASNNYYSKYDKNLNYLATNSSLVPLLFQSPGCGNYGQAYIFNLGYIAPACVPNYPQDFTNCNNAIYYNSALVPNMPVYTPACFEAGSSLSHFEDMCFPTTNAANNNQYFVMSNATLPGTNKRFLKLEEKNTLCDLGYSVVNTYTSNAVSASTVYGGSSCITNPVRGVNDGILTSGYQYSSTGGPVTIPIIGTNGVIANDYQGSNPVTTVSCVQSVYNNGTAAVSGTNIIFTPSGTNTGVFVIRYVPLNSNGETGNITYIFGFILPSFCGPVSPCNMVQNGGFENNTSCGSIPSGLNTIATCWLKSTLSPDLFVRNCGVGSGPSSANLGFNTYSSFPVFDSYNGAPNNAVMGIGAYSSTIGLALSESLANYLNSPILNNQAYTLSFWAYQYSGAKFDPQATLNAPQSFNTGSISAVLSFANDNIYSPPIYNSQTFPYTSLVTIQSVTLANVFNVWKHYSVTFTTSTTSSGNWLYVGMDRALTFTNIVNSVGLSSSGNRLFYTLLDDISLRPASQAPQLNVPSQICNGQALLNLGQYVNIPGGIFSGPGISSNTLATPNGTTTQYHFNAALTLTNGIYTLVYTYTDNIQCTQTAIQQITIGNTISGLGLSYVSGTTCVNAATLSINSPTPSYSYTWQPGNFQGTVVNVSSAAPVTYTVFGTSSSTCAVSGSIAVLPNGVYAQLSLYPNMMCPSSSVQISATGNFTSVTWQPGNYSTAVVIVTPTVPTTYTAIVTGNYGCTASLTTYVPIGTAPTVSISASTGTVICPNMGSTLTAAGAVNYYWNNLLGSSAVNVVYPNSPTYFTVTAYDTNGCAGIASILVDRVRPKIYNSPSNPICAGESLTLTAQAGANSYQWLPVNLYAGTIVILPQTSGVLTVNANYGNISGNCVVSNTVQVIVNKCISIDSQHYTETHLKIFPNPSDGTVNFVSEKNEDREILIYTVSGQLYKRIHLDESNEHKLTVADLAAGLYFLVSEGFTSKLVITN